MLHCIISFENGTTFSTFHSTSFLSSSKNRIFSRGTIWQPESEVSERVSQQCLVHAPLFSSTISNQNRVWERSPIYHMKKWMSLCSNDLPRRVYTGTQSQWRKVPRMNSICIPCYLDEEGNNHTMYSRREWLEVSTIGQFRSGYSLKFHSLNWAVRNRKLNRKQFTSRLIKSYICKRNKSSSQNSCRRQQVEEPNGEGQKP